MLDLIRHRWHDITPRISSKIAVFPGDTHFEREVLLDMEQGANLTLSTMRTTLHLGAHADAPSHYHVEGEGIADRDLAPYLGPCEVRHVRVPPRTRLTPEHLDWVKPRAPRLLLATGTFTNPDEWSGDFAALSPELVDWLADSGVILVGLDTPSVDVADDAALLSHAALYRRRLAVLEGVVLDRVPAGVYTLVALPLPIVDGDASPVRAILVEGGGQ